MSFFSEVEKAIEREFRKWTQKAFGPAESDELLFVHRSILEDVESKIHTVSRGQHIFPYNHLRVRLASADPARRALFESAFGQDRRLENDVRECLAGARCEIPAGFSIAIETAEAGPKSFEVVYEIREVVAATAVPEPLQARARAVVLRGKANQESFVIDKPRTNIGRLLELTDFRQRVVRRNDIVFEEGADETNATVSRGHAHIRLDREAGAYRICDDGSEYGTRIFRDGRSIEVPPGGQRGERLSAGDEIYLGRACIRFELVE
jgi:hypothetical protein